MISLMFILEINVFVVTYCVVVAWSVVNKISFKSHLSRPMLPEQLGMTLLEMLLAMMMLVVFTGVVASVMQFTLRFFTAAESGEQNEFEVSNGVLIDHQQIQMVMDGLVEVLSQPGISVEDIAFAPESVNPAVACPPARPVTQWGLPMREVSLPPGYRLCLWTTTAMESSMSALIEDVDGEDTLSIMSLDITTRTIFMEGALGDPRKHLGHRVSSPLLLQLHKGSRTDSISGELIAKEAVSEEDLTHNIDQVHGVSKEHLHGPAIVLSQGVHQILGQCSHTFIT